ncbi:hypothetical protein C4D60_Mb10t26770 [Musa balbisiana]|uniref:Uncharacterized protein n=1 Tax=Musa balbisiana TaxID=52838 RepID=A0A4S8J055_MUSBA|nr:hypothetical protein C4D60_Mb10t26770 [Musa balbisiana]
MPRLGRAPKRCLFEAFHPSCMGMTIEQAKKLDHFLCSDCDSQNDAERSMNGFPASPSSEPKLVLKSSIHLTYAYDTFCISLN